MKGGEDMEKDDSKVLPVENTNKEAVANAADAVAPDTANENEQPCAASEADGAICDTAADKAPDGAENEGEGDSVAELTADSNGYGTASASSDTVSEDAAADIPPVSEKPAEKKRTSKPRIKGEASSRRKKAQATEIDVEVSETDTPEFSAVEIDEATAARLEEEAIAALPHAESLDSLIYDSYDDTDSHESSEEKESYESFLADYKRLISEALTYSSEKSGDTVESDEATDGKNADAESDSTADNATEFSDGKDVDGEVEAGEGVTLPQDEDGESSDGIEQLEMELELPEKKEAASPDDAEIPPEEEDEPEYNPEKPRKIDSVFDFVELFVFTLLAVMVLTSFFFRNSIVDGNSMNGTLKDGEHLIITDVFYTPERGDIIVFEDFTIDTTEPLVKRVIAVEGDMIRVTGGKVYVNEELIAEPYVSSLETRKDVPLMTVPEGEVFVMGDNRGDSHDSRDFGTVSVDSILGKVILRFYPFDKFGKVE